jgi:hypothetical protein
MEPLSTALLLTAIGGLLILSGLASRLSQHLGVPALLIFLLLGIAAGSEGIGGIPFADYSLAFRLGIIALVLILFDGGLNTSRDVLRRAAAPATMLATGAVVLTALLVAAVGLLLDLSPSIAILVGAVVSSTDAAAVFAVLRGSGIRLKEKTGAVLEVESGLNDPMAFFLTNWLQVSASTKLPEVEERKGDKLEAKMMNLFSLKAQQQSLDFILPGKSAFDDDAQFVERVSTEALAPPFALLAVPWIRFDIRPQPSIDYAFASGFAGKASLQIEHGTWQSKASGTSDSFAVLQPWGQQPHGHLVNRGNRQGRPDVAVVVHQRDHFLPRLVFGAALPDSSAPFLATVFAPSPGSRERANLWAASSCLTEAPKARSSEPSSAPRANSLKTPG